MKTRIDFVSNSSSCSFIIEDIKTMLPKFKIFDGVNVPYEIENEVSISISTTYRHWFKLRDILVELGLCESGLYNKLPDDYFKKSLKDNPDELSWDYFSLTLPSFIDMCCSEKCEEICDIVSEIRFRSEDYGSGPMYLYQLFMFCKINGGKPDASESEHSFADTSEQFFTLLAKVV